MTIEQSVIDAVRALTPDKQREVLDFAEFLRRRGAAPQERSTGFGLWADLGIDVTAEDIAEVRRELWHDFPRDFPSEDHC